MSASLNRIVAVNTLSNYVLIAIRIVYAILIRVFYTAPSALTITVFGAFFGLFLHMW